MLDNQKRDEDIPGHQRRNSPARTISIQPHSFCAPAVPPPCFADHQSTSLPTLVFMISLGAWAMTFVTALLMTGAKAGRVANERKASDEAPSG